MKIDSRRLVSVASSFVCEKEKYCTIFDQTSM